MQLGNYMIKVNGKDITATIADRLIKLTITDNAGIDSDSIEIELDDRKPHIKEPGIDADLQAWIGLKGNLKYAGLYIVSETESDDKGRTLTIYGTGADMVGTLKAPRDHSYHNPTLGDLITTIADRHNYNPAITDELKGYQLQHIDQRGESDLALLTRLTSPLDAIAKAQDRRLIILPKDRGKTVSGKELPIITLDAVNKGLYIRSITKGRAKYKQVTAHYKTKDMPQKIVVKVGVSGGASKSLKDVYETETAATKAAQAELDKLNRDTVEIAATIPGDPNYKAEHKLDLTNHRKAGHYTIQSATHTITGSQVYTTSFEATTGKLS